MLDIERLERVDIGMVGQIHTVKIAKDVEFRIRRRCNGCEHVNKILQIKKGLKNANLVAYDVVCVDKATSAGTQC